MEDDNIDSTAREIPWPEGGEKLLTSGDGHMNACLNFIPDAAEGYVTGYKLAGDVLVLEVQETRANQDRLVFPILYCYRHYVELRLKHIIRNASILLEQKNPTRGHFVDQLWNKARSLIEAVYPEGDRTDLESVEDLISQIAQVDPGSTAFRYDRDLDGSKNLENVVQIDLANVYDVMARLAGFLDSVDIGISCFIESKTEMERNMQDYVSDWEMI